MLTVKALQNAVPLTEVLDRNRLSATPIPGTPLEALVRATRSDSKFNVKTGDDYFPDIQNIEYIANAKDPVTNMSPHDVAMDEIVAVASRAVQGHISFARTVVAPAVAELVEKTAAYMRDLVPSKLLGMEVIVWSPPAPLVNNAFESLVKKFEETPFDVPKLAMRLPTITVAEILELMKVGSKGIDTDIELWAANKGESFFINLWEEIFQIKQAPLNQSTNITFKDHVLDTDKALAIFLISRKLDGNPLANTEMTASAFDALIIEFRNQSGAALCRYLEELDGVVKNKVLVRASVGENTAIVNESVYKDWIEAGGENEILFGNMLSKNPLITVDQINAAATELKAAWTRHSILISTLESNKRFSRTKETLASCFEKQLRDVPEGETFTLANRENVLKLFNEELSKVRESDMSDMYNLCLQLVCRSRFSNTDSEMILAGIEKVARDNPTVDVREAAAISVINYICYWISSQIKLVVI